MKKTFFSLLVLCCLSAAPAAQAQTINEYHPDEISASYGVSVIGVAVNTLARAGNLISRITDGDYVAIKSGGSKGVINLGYVHHFNKTVGVGGSFGFNRMSLNLEDRTGSVTAAAANMFSLMADAKFNWFRGDVFGMYSKLGLGVMCLNGSMMEESGGNIWLPTGQLSLIGMELGRQFCGFLEIGPGMQGIAQIGFKYHF